MNGPIDIFLGGELIGRAPCKRPEGEHCRIPTQQDVRIAFMSAQQSLRQLQEFPASLLNLATFPFVNDEGQADIDRAVDLLRLEVAKLETAIQNYRAIRSQSTEIETI
jgi:hypothetical protein